MRLKLQEIMEKVVDRGPFEFPDCLEWVEHGFDVQLHALTVNIS